jgi:hypothetical protein
MELQCNSDLSDTTFQLPTSGNIHGDCLLADDDFFDGVEDSLTTPSVSRATYEPLDLNRLTPLHRRYDETALSPFSSYPEPPAVSFPSSDATATREPKVLEPSKLTNLIVQSLAREPHAPEERTIDATQEIYGFGTRSAMHLTSKKSEAPSSRKLQFKTLNRQVETFSDTPPPAEQGKHSTERPSIRTVLGPCQDRKPKLRVRARLSSKNHTKTAISAVLGAKPRLRARDKLKLQTKHVGSLFTFPTFV